MQPDNHPVEKFSKMQEEEMWIYETKAGNANECSSYETYNEESSVCYYECSSDEECDDIGANIDEEIAGWYDENRQDGEYLAAGDETALAENDDSLRAEYLVSE